MSAALSKPGVVEGQTLDGDLKTDADVCIVGSGAGGAVTAAVLAEAGLPVDAKRSLVLSLGRLAGPGVRQD